MFGRWCWCYICSFVHLPWLYPDIHSLIYTYTHTKFTSNVSVGVGVGVLYIYFRFWSVLCDVEISSCHAGNEWIMRLSLSINHWNVNVLANIVSLCRTIIPHFIHHISFSPSLSLYFFSLKLSHSSIFTFSTLSSLVLTFRPKYIYFFFVCKILHTEQRHRMRNESDKKRYEILSVPMNVSIYLFFMGDRIHSIIADAFISIHVKWNGFCSNKSCCCYLLLLCVVVRLPLTWLKSTLLVLVWRCRYFYGHLMAPI